MKCRECGMGMARAAPNQMVSCYCPNRRCSSHPLNYMRNSQTMAYAVKHRDLLLVRTVADTELAAMVNWIVTYCGTLVTKDWSTEDIKTAFRALSAQVGGSVSVVDVITIEMGERENARRDP